MSLVPLLPTPATPLVEVRCGGRSCHLVTHSIFYVCVVEKRKKEKSGGGRARPKNIKNNKK